jgi:hypothetical protein
MATPVWGNTLSGMVAGFAALRVGRVSPDTLRIIA